LPDLPLPHYAVADFSDPRTEKAVTKRSDPEERFDVLAAEVSDWTESAVALDAGHFPKELLSDLEDLIEELKGLVEEEPGYDHFDVTELFVNPEMNEIVERFPRVRRMLEGAWGSRLLELLEEESGMEALDVEDEE
jgi:hypothetical protein